MEYKPNCAVPSVQAMTKRSIWKFSDCINWFNDARAAKLSWSRNTGQTDAGFSPRCAYGDTRMYERMPTAA